MELALQVATTALLAALYTAATIRVRRRHEVSPARAAAFATGLALLAAGLVLPLERRFSTHMLQHLLIGDLAPLFIVLGLDGPLLRPLLAVGAVRRLRPLAHPLVALPLWATDLAAWHAPRLYDAALGHGSVHALQHTMFFTFGSLLWAALLEPLPGPAWFTTGRKLVYVGSMWIVMLALSQAFLWSNHAFYAGYAVGDQRAGGGVMLVEGSLVMLGVTVWLLLRAFGESERRIMARPARRGPRFGT